jgi:hypothetical protein
MMHYRVHARTNDGWKLVTTYTDSDKPQMCAEELWAFNWLEETGSEYVKIGFTMYDIAQQQEDVR